MTHDLTDAAWFTSTRSNGSDQCVEVALNLPGVVGVRDSKDRQGPALRLTPAGWSAFVAAVKHGSFD